MYVREELVELLGEEITQEIDKLSDELKAKINIDKTREILQVLDEEGIDRSIIKTNGSILAKGEANKIKDVLKALEEIGIGRENIELYGGLLSETNGNNIMQINEIFKRYNLVSIIKSNPNVLITNAKNAEQLLRLYDRENLLDVAKNFPSRIYNPSYSLVLSRINYLKERHIALSYTDDKGQERFNTDIFMPAKDFEKKYGIDGKKLKADYGKEPTDMKKGLEQALKGGITLEDAETASKNMKSLTQDKNIQK